MSLMTVEQYIESIRALNLPVYMFGKKRKTARIWGRPGGGFSQFSTKMKMGVDSIANIHFTMGTKEAPRAKGRAAGRGPCQMILLGGF